MSHLQTSCGSCFADLKCFRIIWVSRFLQVYCCVNLLIQTPRVPPVVLSRRIVAQIALKHAGESHGRQHAHHRRQSQHETDHHTGEIHRADGVQHHWRAAERLTSNTETLSPGPEGKRPYRTHARHWCFWCRTRGLLGRCTPGREDQRRKKPRWWADAPIPTRWWEYEPWRSCTQKNILKWPQTLSTNEIFVPVKNETLPYMRFWVDFVQCSS